MLWHGSETLKVFERSNVSTTAYDTATCEVPDGSRSATFTVAATSRPDANLSDEQQSIIVDNNMYGRTSIRIISTGAPTY